MIIKRFMTLASIATVLLAAISATPASPRGHHAHHHATSGHKSHHRSSASYSGAYYTNIDGRPVHRPVFTDRAPDGASARCGDGSYSFSLHRRGTCSRHGGVERWL